MKYRKLGKTNLSVSEIGMGTWQITDDPDWGKGPSEKESFQNLQKFIDLGGNLIDTAWIYGYDESKPKRHPSEELIGKFLKQTKQRDNVIITTKIPPKDFNWPIRKGRRINEIFPNDHIIKCVDESLQSLQVDSIDLMLFHAWRDEYAKEDSWKELCQKLTAQGKVKNWGLSPSYYEPASCLNTLDTGIISVVQCIFNIFHQRPIEELFPKAKKLDIGIVACVPLDEGGLTGKITQDTKFQEGDFRAEYFAGDRLNQLVERTKKLETLLGKEVKALPELALRFILSFDEMSAVIPGMRNPKNIEANTSISDGRKLSSTLLNELKLHAWERNFYPWAFD